MFESWKHRRAAAAAQSGDAELKRYLESHDSQPLERAIGHLQQGAKRLPDSDTSKVRCMLSLAGAYVLRFGNRNNRADFRAAISWNEQALAANPDGVSKAHAFFNIGALQFEEYKRSRELSFLEAAVDRFIQSLQSSEHEHPVRKLLIISLQATLAELTLKTPDAMKTADRWHKAITAVPFRSLEQKDLQAAWHAAFGHRAQIDDPTPVCTEN